MNGTKIQDARDAIIRACINGLPVVESSTGRRVVDLSYREDDDVHVYGRYADDKHYYEYKWRFDDVEVVDEIKDVAAAAEKFVISPVKEAAGDSAAAARTRNLAEGKASLLRAHRNGGRIACALTGKRVLDIEEVHAGDPLSAHLVRILTSDGPKGMPIWRTARVMDLEIVCVDGAPPSFRKADAGKSIVGAVPPRALLAVGRVLAHGAAKYGRDNWRKVDDVRRYHDAAMRHVLQYLSGERTDAESGESHLAHAVCSLMFVLDIDEGAEIRISDGGGK